jgi:alanyl aminopeptidase
VRSALGALVGLAALSCQAPTVHRRHGPAAEPIVPALPAVAPTSEPVPLGPLPGDVRLTHESLALTVDPASDRFGGTAELALHLTEPRDRIWLHGRGLTVSAATLRVAGTPDTALPARWDEVDPTGVVRLTLPKVVSGDVTLQVAFTAAYDAQLVGVYRVQTSAGPAVFSKFEAIYARRAFPCFDEPAFKVPFDVTLTVPDGQLVIGNMPIAEEAAAGPGRTQIRFLTTPPLPSYLVAFAVGPFEARATTLSPGPSRAKPLPIGAVAVRGRGAATGYALAATPALVAEQERYFGLGFPFPKLDLVAVPDFQSGAMENAGAITFRDSALLVDDRVTSLEQRIAVTSVIAHETAHQWFGDLVTMPWWDDLWLNEGFATFLATRTLRQVRPELEAELKASYGIDTVMALDSLASARRIRQPIETTHDITNAFDGITYEKGAAVLAMLEHFLGDEPFRRGLHDFLAAHAGGNATTADLLDALATASGQALGPLVSSFLEQPGVPSVAVALHCERGRGRVELSQSRWRAVGSTVAAASPWTIPVCVRAGHGGRVETTCTVLGEPTGGIDLAVCPDWILPNADAAGYYRMALSSDLVERLRHGGIRQLSVVERVRLAHDLAAAFRSAALPGDEVLRALEPVAADAHGAVAQAPLGLFGFVNEFMVEGAAQKALRAHLAALYAPAVARLGWRPAPHDRPWNRLFRTALLEALALTVEDPAVLGEAARLGRRLLGADRDHVRHPDAVAPDLASVALQAAARTGGAEVFDALVRELAGSEDAQLRQRMLVALGSSREPALVTRALDLSLDPRLRQNERLVALGRLLGERATRDASWAWLKQHFDALVVLLPDRYGAQIPGFLRVCDAQRAEELRAFFAPRIDGLTGGPRKLAQVLEAAQQCAALVEAQRERVTAYVRGLRSP